MYEVFFQYAAILTIDAVDHIDARKQAYGSTVLEVFDHNINLTDEAIFGVHEARDQPPWASCATASTLATADPVGSLSKSPSASMSGGRRPTTSSRTT